MKSIAASDYNKNEGQLPHSVSAALHVIFADDLQEVLLDLSDYPTLFDLLGKL